MSKLRRNAWSLHATEGLWNDTMLWYAKGVAALQARPLADRTSWRFLAAIHNYDAPMWTDFGYFDAGKDPLPSDADIARFWAQCEHGDWFFLPWHRGYLAAFEQIVSAAVVALGGPSDWALPYWNYNEAERPGVFPRRIPPCFLEATLPDGSPNPLASPYRYGLDADGTMMNVDERSLSDRRALLEGGFAGTDGGGSGGFGGSPSGSGQVEQSPHNYVHTHIGGLGPYGLMSSTETAGLDPVFWLHHANIDRLWQVWLNRDPLHTDPPEGSPWMDGSTIRDFVMPTADGGEWPFMPRDMLDTAAPRLDYAYDDTVDPYPGQSENETRLLRFGVPRDRIHAAKALEMMMSKTPDVELLGANDRALRLGADGGETEVAVDARASNTLLRSFRTERLLSGAPKAPDRVFLNLENVRGTREEMVLTVYLNLPPDARPEAHPECRVGSVSLFGMRMASRTESAHAGNGLNLSIEITEHVDALGLDAGAGLGDLRVKLVPQAPLGPEDEITIGRIGLYRQGE